MDIATQERPETLTIEKILEQAHDRARRQGASYAGALLPTEAWQLVQRHPKARLVDVRTREEWHLVGTAPSSLLIEWRTYPAMERNPRFLDELTARAALDELVILLCRSAVRSHEAAEFLTKRGYQHAFNVLEGFEGDKNELGQRGITGWKMRGLPWSQ